MRDLQVEDVAGAGVSLHHVAARSVHHAFRIPRGPARVSAATANIVEDLSSLWAVLIVGRGKM